MAFAAKPKATMPSFYQRLHVATHISDKAASGELGLIPEHN